MSADAVQAYATLAGSRSGSAVAFHKIYDGEAPHYHAVDYAATLNADATEVEGRWVIRGVWSGKFLMIRPARKEESVERKVAQRARGFAPLGHALPRAYLWGFLGSR